MSNEEPPMQLLDTVAGNATSDAKELVLTILHRAMPGFAQSVCRRIVVTEVSQVPKVEEPEKMESKVVCEITVEKDMINFAGSIHGGCSAFLVDVCSSLCLIATGRVDHVSQAINMVYHAPAPEGHTLRIVSTTLTTGSRVLSARTEIWDSTSKRLVASGVHIKMGPSPPKL